MNVPSTHQLLQTLQSASEHLSTNDRRDFLRRGMSYVAGSAAIVGSTMASATALNSNLPPNEPQWGKQLGTHHLTSH